MNGLVATAAGVDVDRTAEEELMFAAQLALMPRPPAAGIGLSDHAQRRFAERIDDTIDPEVGLRLLLDEVLAVPGQVHLRGGAIVHKHSVQDVTVVITAGFGTVLTVYRAAEHPRRERWRVPVACAA